MDGKEQAATFQRQLEEARIRCGLPETATAWEIMMSNAAHEAATAEMWRTIMDSDRIYFSPVDPTRW